MADTRFVENDTLPRRACSQTIKDRCPLRDRQSHAPRNKSIDLKEIAMPHVIVKLWPGKTEQQKNRLAEAITKNVMNILQYGEESVSVAMEEVKPQDWVERVYKPDIKRNLDKLYKKPGYDEKDL
jgi:4-oxalocrotonate tautomerase